MPAPFNAGAPLYLQGGLWPIPVRGKNMPVSGATGYDGTVTPEKVAGWLVSDVTLRAKNGRGVGVDNVALRHQLSLAIDVDQGYGSKGGVAELAAFAARLGLPPLPGTWSSTARGDDSPSRQYIYRIEADERLKTKPCDSVELCNWHHRFTVCWPSIHPNGNVYTWYQPGDDGVPPGWGAPIDGAPTLADFAWLPKEWYRAFLGTGPNAGRSTVDRSVATVAVPELLATFPQGEPDGLVRYHITKWSDENQHVGHDEAKNALITAFMLGREGHPGVVELYEVIVGRLADYLATARPGLADLEMYGSQGDNGLIAACADIAQQRPVKPIVVGRMPTVEEFMAGAEVLPAEGQVQAPVIEPADDETWEAFRASFTLTARPRMGENRRAWLEEALLTRPDPISTFQYHATKAIGEAMQGRYSSSVAVTLLRQVWEARDLGPAEYLDVIMRACLTAALNDLEGAAR
jgi:hypothetical protein